MAERRYIAPREFIQIWQQASSTAEVARKVGLKKAACRTRACRYRKEGVPLKQFPQVVIEPPDWTGLAEYAASLLPKEGRTQDG
jgi:hypothetical protein